MPKNHAKAIKGMSIACIALSGLVILVAIGMMFLLSFLDAIMVDVYSDPYYGGYDMSDYYDSIFGAYGLGGSIVGLDATHGMHHDASAYGYYDYYDDYASYKLAAMVANVMLVCGIIGAAVTLAAGIVVLRNHNKPEKFNLAFGWSIVGAVLGFLTTGVIQGVLFIIIAVFINSDKKLYQAGMYFVPVPGMPGAVSAYPPQQPVGPVVPGAPLVPVAQVPAQPVQGVQAAPMIQDVQPGRSVPAPEASAQPAEQPMAQVTIAESFQPVGQPSVGMGETQPPAPAEAEAAPVVVDDGAVIKLEADGDQPSEK